MDWVMFLRSYNQMESSKKKYKRNCLSEGVFRSNSIIHSLFFSYENKPSKNEFKVGIDDELEIVALRMIAEALGE